MFGCRKTFSGKGKYFSVFGCISKNFPENIFWCLEKKKENTNPRKISSEIAISPARSRDQRRELATARSRAIDHDLRSRSEARARDNAISRRRQLAILRRRELAPLIARSRRRDRNLRLRSLMVFYWVCVFLFLFQIPENIFWKIF